MRLLVSATWYIDAAEGSKHDGHAPTPVDGDELSFAGLTEHRLRHRSVTEYLHIVKLGVNGRTKEEKDTKDET